MATYKPTDISGKVSGPASATDNAIMRFDGTTGKTAQNSGVTIDDSNGLTVPGSLYFGGTNNYRAIYNSGGTRKIFELYNGTSDTSFVQSYTGIGRADIQAFSDSESNVNLYLGTKGTGKVYAKNGVDGYSDVVATETHAQTLTNKRVTPRVNVVGSDGSATTPASDTYDLVGASGATANFTVNAPTGTPTDGQKLLLRFKDNGTARTITWNAIYRAVGVTLPTTTVISKLVYIGCVYNTADTKWDVIAVAQGA